MIHETLNGYAGLISMNRGSIYPFYVNAEENRDSIATLVEEKKVKNKNKNRKRSKIAKISRRRNKRK